MMATLPLQWLLALVATVGGVRENGDTRAAPPALLQRRANGGMRMKRSRLDTVLKRKGDEEDDVSLETSCICMLEEVETEHAFWGEYKIKFADLDDEREFDSKEECSTGCPLECHQKIKYKFDPHEAKTAGIDGLEVPMTASKCDDNGECECLDAKKTTSRVKQYGQLEGMRIDIVPTVQMWDSPAECLMGCECKDHHEQGYVTERQLDFEGLCMDEWKWNWFLRYGEQSCYDRKAIGLVSCDYTQQFVIKEDTQRGGHAYKVKLEQLEDGSGKEVAKEIGAKIVRFEAESDKMYRTSEVEVGPKGARTRWTVFKSSLMSQRWVWTVADEAGRVRFSINQQRWQFIKGFVWKVYDGLKSDDRHLYYGFGDKEAESNEEGFVYNFYRDEGRTEFAGKMEHKSRDEEDNEDKYEVKVNPGEDAAAILFTCVLIDKANNR